MGTVDHAGAFLGEFARGFFVDGLFGTILLLKDIAEVSFDATKFVVEVVASAAEHPEEIRQAVLAVEEQGRALAAEALGILSNRQRAFEFAAEIRDVIDEAKDRLKEAARDEGAKPADRRPGGTATGNGLERDRGGPPRRWARKERR